MLILQMMWAMAAIAQTSQTAPAAAKKAAAAEQAEVAARHCKARQFEAVVTLEVEGKPRRSRIRLCGKEGQSDSDWIRTLKDGADKLAANDKLPKAAKDQALGAINAEISKLTPKASAVLPADLGGYSILPPLPAPRPRLEPAPAYSALPPLEPKPAASAVVAASAPVVVLPRPRLRIDCLTPGDLGSGGACLTVERDTLLTIRADEQLAAGTSLRFSRKGEARAELALAQMRKGQVRRARLPLEVCAGGGGGRLEVEIVRQPTGTGIPQVVGSLGPYQLRC